MDEDAVTNVHLLLSPGHTALTEPVRSVLAGFKAVPRRQFNDTDDEELSRFWLIGVAASDAPSLVEALLSSPDVDGAYTVPSDEPA